MSICIFRCSHAIMLNCFTNIILLLCLIKSSFDLNEGYDDLDDENSKVIINLNFNRIIPAELTHKNTL